MTQYEVAKVVCSGLVGCAEAEDERLRDNQPSASHPANTPVCIIMVFMIWFYIFIIFTFSHQTSVAV